MYINDDTRAERAGKRKIGHLEKILRYFTY